MQRYLRRRFADLLRLPREIRAIDLTKHVTCSYAIHLANKHIFTFDCSFRISSAYLRTDVIAYFMALHIIYTQ
jgi:hypothetical protein